MDTISNMQNNMTILEQIARNQLVEKLSRQLIQNDPNKDDFIGEIYLILAEKSEQLETFKEQTPNNLRNYIITIIRNQYLSSSSDYHVKYRKNWSDRYSDINFDLNEDNEIIIKDYVKD